MKNFIKIDEHGNILEQGSTQLKELDAGYIFVDNLPESDGYKYNTVTKKYELKEVPINELKSCKNEEIKSKWQEKVDANFEHSGNTFKCDEKSLMRIGARLAHSNSKTNLSVAEKTYYDIDRNAVEFADKASFETFCKELIEHRNFLDQHAEVLKRSVEDAGNETELNDIDLETGW